MSAFEEYYNKCYPDMHMLKGRSTAIKHMCKLAWQAAQSQIKGEIKKLADSVVEVEYKIDIDHDNLIRKLRKLEADEGE